ncbi:MAG: hypothetical protein WD096_08860 [Actinomycetota bacterium]
MGYFERRRARKQQEKIERLKAEVTPIIASGEETTAQMMVSVAAQQVREGELRSDDELRDDLGCDGDKDAIRRLLQTHDLARMMLATRFAPDPLTPQIAAQLDRKIAIMRELIDRD